MNKFFSGNPLIWLLFCGFGFYLGYGFPRDLEIESTKPIAFEFKVDREAAALLARSCKVPVNDATK